MLGMQGSGSAGVPCITIVSSAVSGKGLHTASCMNDCEVTQRLQREAFKCLLSESSRLALGRQTLDDPPTYPINRLGACVLVVQSRHPPCLVITLICEEGRLQREAIMLHASIAIYLC